jgi:hypothetical protein
VAVVTNEWTKVEKLLAAGRNFDQLIRLADARRLAAILDRLPTELAIQSPDPEGVIQEVEQLTLARLAELGDPKAVEFAEVDRAARYESAWAGVVAGAERGEVSVAAWSALNAWAPDEYSAIGVEGSLEEVEVASRLKQLDRTAEASGGADGSH